MDNSEKENHELSINTNQCLLTTSRCLLHSVYLMKKEIWRTTESKGHWCSLPQFQDSLQGVTFYAAM